jgi:hypothetical protein
MSVFSFPKLERKHAEAEKKEGKRGKKEVLIEK